MKRWIVIVVGLATAALGGAALWNICSHRVVKSQLSEVYNRYKDRSDLRVAFVKDYRIDDSTNVDVTTLTAKDSASWEALLREMNVKEGMIAIQREAVREGNAVVAEYYCANNHPEQRIKLKECTDFDLVLYSFYEYVIYIFDINTIEQGRRIQAHKNNEILK